MGRPDFLTSYLFDWELFSVIIGGKSALDSHSFLTPMKNREQVLRYLEAYGFDQSDPILKAELFGYYQEAIQFMRRYFLSDQANEDFRLEMPNVLTTLNDVSDLFLLASGHREGATLEECLWAAAVLKVMHTILHADKDLRTNYFNVIQQQIFDRFYKFMNRDDDNNLFLTSSHDEKRIPLFDFQTKAKKSRASVIIKLLHKPENVAEELFDRVGVRFITHNVFDSIQVIKFLQENNAIMAHNIKPSRSMNTLIDLVKFKKKHSEILKTAIRNKLSEDDFVHLLNKEVLSLMPDPNEAGKNKFSSDNYRAIQFTCRQLISYKNPIINKISEIKRLAKEDDQDDKLHKKISKLDLSLLSRDIRFFYPYEVQIVDKESYETNTRGEASHDEYKKSQLLAARNRVLQDILRIKNIN
jgi:uncharacterized protein (TIGR04562 family)